MAVQDILNFVQLTDRVGTSGQPTPAQFADIAAAGYRAVVNLALPNSDNAIADEGGVVSALRLSYFHLPVLFDAPQLSELRTFIGLMRVLEDRPVWVHCAMNLRVSAFMYHYLRHDLELPEGGPLRASSRASASCAGSYSTARSSAARWTWPRTSRFPSP